MGAIMTRIRLGTAIRMDMLLAELSGRTGLQWHGSEEVLPDGSHQIVLSVPSRRWEVRVSRDDRLGAYDVEVVPTHWTSINYEFWQVIGYLVRMGGVHVSRGGEETPVRLPRWTDTKWDDLSWWARMCR